MNKRAQGLVLSAKVYWIVVPVRIARSIGFQAASFRSAINNQRTCRERSDQSPTEHFTGIFELQENFPLQTRFFPIN